VWAAGFTFEKAMIDSFPAMKEGNSASATSIARVWFLYSDWVIDLQAQTLYLG